VPFCRCEPEPGPALSRSVKKPARSIIGRTLARHFLTVRGRSATAPAMTVPTYRGGRSGPARGFSREWVATTHNRTISRRDFGGREERSSDLKPEINLRSCRFEQLKMRCHAGAGLTTQFSPLRIRRSHVSRKCENSKSPAHGLNQRNPSCAGRETRANATRFEADEPVVELELQSRLRVVGTHPNSRSRSTLQRAALGLCRRLNRASTYFRPASAQSGTQPQLEPMPSKLKTPSPRPRKL
jgi:hypothetical protein